MSLPKRSRQAAVTLAATIVLAANSSLGWAADSLIRAIDYDSANQTVVIDASSPVRAAVNTLDISGRRRIIIDVDNASLGQGLPRDVELARQLNRVIPTLRNVTTHQYGSTGHPMVRILLDLDGNTPPVRVIQNHGNRLEFAIGQPNTNYRTGMNRIPLDAPTPSPQEKGTTSTGTPATTASKPWYPPGTQPLSASRRPPISPTYAAATAAASSSTPVYKAYGQPADRQNESSASNASPAVSTQELKQALITINNRYEALQAEQQRLIQQNRQLQIQANEQPDASKSKALKQAQEQLRQQQDKNEALQKQLNETQADSSKADTEARLRQQLQTAQAESRRLQDQINALQRSNATAQSGSSSNSQLTRLQTENTQLQQQVQLLRDASSNGQNEPLKLTRQLEEDKQAFQQQVATLQQQQATSAQRLNELQEENRKLLTQNQDFATRSENRQKTRSSIDTEKTQKLADDNETLSRQNRHLKAESDQARKQIEKQLKSLQSDNADLRKQVERANADAARAKNSPRTASAAQTTASTSTSGSSSSELGQMKKQVAAAQMSLNEAIKTINEQNKEMVSLRSQIGSIGSNADVTLSQQLTQMQGEVSDKNTQIQTLERQVMDLKQSNLAAKTAAASKPAPSTPTKGALPNIAKVQHEKIQQDLNNLKQENASLKQQLASAATAKSVSTPVDLTPSDSDGAEKHYQAAKAALSAKQPSQALDEFKAAISQAPNNNRYAIDYSEALADTRRYPEGINSLTDYLGRNPTDREALMHLGKLYLLNDQPDAAVQALTRSIPSSTLNNYATALKKTNRVNDAEGIFKLALQMNPRDSEVLFNLGNLYNTKEKPDQAKTYYEKALVERPNFAEAHYNLGLVLAKLNDKPNAIAHLQQYLKLSPQTKNADDIRTYIQKLQ